MLTRPSRLQRLAQALSWWLRGIPVLLMAGCASPDTVRPFPGFPGYTERYVDPGTVNDACYVPGEHLDNGLLKQWNDEYCGCVDTENRTVWIARSIRCDLAHVRKHETCHLTTGPGKADRMGCAKETM